jgi:hypothetical protein
MSQNFPVEYIPAAFPDADLYAGDLTTDRVKCPGNGKLHILAIEGAGGVGHGTWTVHAHLANSGGTPEAIEFRYKVVTAGAGVQNYGGFTLAPDTGVAVAAGANKQVLIEITPGDLPSGKRWISATLTETDSTAVDAAVEFIIIGGDHPGAGLSSL